MKMIKNASDVRKESLESLIFKLLKKYQISLTTAESCTGGLIAATLINVPGISAFLTEGYVTYSDDAKVKMLGVDREVIEQHGVVSAATAAQMAICVAQKAQVQAALSSTGVAGPDGGTTECPVGTVYLGCCLNGNVVTEHHILKGNRQEVRAQAVECALQLLIKQIQLTYECDLTKSPVK